MHSDGSSGRRSCTIGPGTSGCRRSGAWWPSENRDEFAFVVEDDVEVSPLYYRFVREVIGKYYYDERSFSPWIYGITLQRPRFVPGKHGNKIVLDGQTRVLLYQLVATWGQILFPKHWKEFRRWYDDYKAKDIKPVLDGMMTTGWYKRRRENMDTLVHQRKETVLLVSIVGVSDGFVRNMLCHFQRLDISNYVLVCPGSEALFDLARRGHPVVDADRFLNNVMAIRSRRYQGSSLELTRSIMTKVYVLKKCMELGYNAWPLDENMLFSNLDVFSAPGDNEYDMYILKSSDTFFLRSSANVRKAWIGSFIDEAGTATRSLLNKNSIKGDNCNVVNMVAGLLESRAARIKKIDDQKFGTDIVDITNESTVDGKVVYWSEETSLDSIRKRAFRPFWAQSNIPSAALCPLVCVAEDGNGTGDDGEQEFNRLLALFPVVRSCDFSADQYSSRQSTSSSMQDDTVEEWHDAWDNRDKNEQNNERIDLNDAFWKKLKLAVERKVGGMEAEKFCRAFQQGHGKLVYEVMGVDAANRYINSSSVPED